jgi:ElaB/YqjD/DUF883 family membrane-anchored ribosome-binding protein
LSKTPKQNRSFFLKKEKYFTLTNLMSLRDITKTREGNMKKQGELGAVKDEEIREAYKNNLRRVKENLKELKTILNGKTLVTADHGEFLGENGLYAHSKESNTEILRKVPLGRLENI